MSGAWGNCGGFTYGHSSGGELWSDPSDYAPTEAEPYPWWAVALFVVFVLPLWAAVAFWPVTVVVGGFAWAWFALLS